MNSSASGVRTEAGSTIWARIRSIRMTPTPRGNIKLVVAQLIDSGACRQIDIIKAFGDALAQKVPQRRGFASIRVTPP